MSSSLPQPVLALFSTQRSVLHHFVFFHTTYLDSGSQPPLAVCSILILFFLSSLPCRRFFERKFFGISLHHPESSPLSLVASPLLLDDTPLLPVARSPCFLRPSSHSAPVICPTAITDSVFLTLLKAVPLDHVDFLRPPYPLFIAISCLVAPFITRTPSFPPVTFLEAPLPGVASTSSEAARSRSVSFYPLSFDQLGCHKSKHRGERFFCRFWSCSSDESSSCFFPPRYPLSPCARS